MEELEVFGGVLPPGISGKFQVFKVGGVGGILFLGWKICEEEKRASWRFWRC